MSQALREQLIGAWRLVSCVVRPIDGGPDHFPMGEEPEGLLLYTPDGFMSAQLMTPGRTPFASGDWFEATPQEYEEEATGYIAYAGPFHVDEDRGTLTHSMEVSLFPNWIGQTQPRIVSIEDDELHLSTVTPVKSGGAFGKAYLTWKRAPCNASGVQKASETNAHS